VEAISATRRNTTGIAPSFIVMKTETNDEAEKRRRSHWDDFIFWQNV
jgi:ribosomal protein L39E